MTRNLSILLFLLVAVILSAAGWWMISPAKAARLDLLLSMLSSGEIEPKIILVDDFQDGDLENNLGGNENCWSVNGGTATCDVSVVGNDGFIWMEYDVRAPDSYGVAFSELLNLNMSTLDTVWVSIKGADGNEPIYLEVRDCDYNVPKEVIGDHLAPGISAAKWRAVAIPRTEYVDITDWRCIDRLNIIPHNTLGSGQGTIYIDEMRLLPAHVVVDDFHDISPLNELGGDSGFWNNDTGFLTFSYPQGVLKLDYNVTTTDPTAEAVYWTGLLDTNLLLYKDMISFKVRQHNGTEEVAVEFIDCGLSGESHIPKIKVSDYLADGLSTDWQRVSIPLATFADGMDWRCVEQINFLVSAKSWFNSGQGTVYIDDLVLAPTDKPVPLIVDRFDDCNDWSALTWAWNGSTGDPDSTIEFGHDENNYYGPRGCGFQIKYKVVGSSGTWVYAELKGVDVSDYTHLRFWLKGAVSNEELHVYLRDLTGRQRYYEDITTTTEWQQILIPLDYFSPAVDLTELGEVKFAFEWKPMNGQIFLDDISFTTLENYLPIVMKNYQEICVDTPPSCPASFNTYEPNNYRCSTTFGLSSDTSVQSYICASNDIDDYFYIDVTSLNPISVNLTNIAGGKDYDLYLYYQDAIVAKSDNYGSSNEALTYTPSQAGRYFIRVYPYSGYSLAPYTLVANYQ